MIDPRPWHTNCRICRQELPPPFLDLGAMPLANAFPVSPAEFETEAAYPLAVTACGKCGLAQLNYVVPAEQLYRKYIYVSSTSSTVVAYADALADRLVRRYGWGPRDMIVEVASNDGTVLQAFQRRGVLVLGVEPALNIAAAAEKAGIRTVSEFFTEDLAGRLAEEWGGASAIVARHVLGHVDDVHDFMRGVARLLSRTGLLVLEVPYLGDLVANLEFDTVYHEHLSYFALAPMEALCAMHGLVVVDVERVSLHGGSFVLHVRRDEGADSRGERVEWMRREEAARALLDPRTLERFASEVAAWRGRFEEFVDGLARSGARFVGYGAAAKANTLLNYCQGVARVLPCILDRNPHKQGRYTPGTHVRVELVERWRDAGATHMLILAWNFHEEIIRQMRPFADAGGRFVLPIPEPVIL